MYVECCGEQGRRTVVAPGRLLRSIIPTNLPAPRRVYAASSRGSRAQALRPPQIMSRSRKIWSSAGTGLFL